VAGLSDRRVGAELPPLFHPSRPRRRPERAGVLAPQRRLCSQREVRLLMPGPDCRAVLVVEPQHSYPAGHRAVCRPADDSVGIRQHSFRGRRSAWMCPPGPGRSRPAESAPEMSPRSCGCADAEERSAERDREECWKARWCHYQAARRHWRPNKTARGRQRAGMHSPRPMTDGRSRPTPCGSQSWPGVRTVADLAEVIRPPAEELRRGCAHVCPLPAADGHDIQ